jgi:hypothetical protein
MPQPRLKARTETTPADLNGHATPASFTPPRYVWVESDDPDHLSPDGCPFRAEVRSNLSGRELLAISRPEMEWVELAATLAPWIRDWNAPGPPPVDGGPDALLDLDVNLLEWVWQAIRLARFGGASRKNSLTPATRSDDEQAEPAEGSD